ncbi:hypothetical protein [Clostridium botulinum]|uniref:hypothetical protein n=1 Tax=Clostridium botulinum TaxID=1491 RepID=UPI001748FC43|nr:hypothetical protein [Clostridium botulinum]MBD5589113.1 hypothetical protein [Clostridium botulinum]
MSKLKSKEIDYIVDTYKKLKSIEKTAKETGFSKITVNKYVRDISSTDKRSRYCKNRILQINVNTSEIVKEWNKPSIAAKNLNINPAEICRVLKGELKQAGGYSWKYR